MPNPKPATAPLMALDKGGLILSGLPHPLILDEDESFNTALHVRVVFGQSTMPARRRRRHRIGITVPTHESMSAIGYELPWTGIVEAEPRPPELHALITA